jgi:plasmid stabilization system protein ParE
MDLIVRPEAEDDLARAADWYREHGAAVKEKFISRVEATLNRIANRPSLFPHERRGLRRASIRGFPYSVYFTSTETKVIVVAVLHQRRDPNIIDRRLY